MLVVENNFSGQLKQWSIARRRRAGGSRFSAVCLRCSLVKCGKPFLPSEIMARAGGEACLRLQFQDRCQVVVVRAVATAVLAALQRALVNEGLEPHNVALVAGIGCSGKIGNYINCYNFHVTHGRTLPTAMGLKLANRDLTVLAAGGDGDGFAIGMGHFMHAVRRNPDITYIVMDNHIYGLTKGQISPTSQMGFATKAQPGNIERRSHR